MNNSKIKIFFEIPKLFWITNVGIGCILFGTLFGEYGQNYTTKTGRKLKIGNVYLVLIAPKALKISIIKMLEFYFDKWYLYINIVVYILLLMLLIRGIVGTIHDSCELYKLLKILI